MKKNYLFILFLIGSIFYGIGQTVINFDASDERWLGFMNVYNKPAPDGDGTFQFGNGWGIPDLVAIVDAGNNTVSLKPNRIGDTDGYWQTDGVLEGNKIMNANFYIDDDGLVGTEFTFTGSVSAKTLNDTGLSVAYQSEAFIKVYNADYSSVLLELTSPLEPGDFEITYDNSITEAGIHIQYGFTVEGLNINSRPEFDSQYNDLGEIVITAATLSVENQRIGKKIKVITDRTNESWLFESPNNIMENITIFDTLGKQVASFDSASTNWSINYSSFGAGLYFAQINTNQGMAIKKMIKN